MPRSRARFTIGRALSISTIHSSELPKDIVPRQMRETWSPVGPSWEYCIERQGRIDPIPMFKSSIGLPERSSEKDGYASDFEQPYHFKAQFFPMFWLVCSLEQHPGPQHPQPGPQQLILTLPLGNSVTKVKYLTRQVP